jgi:hypothetical protein
MADLESIARVVWEVVLKLGDHARMCFLGSRQVDRNLLYFFRDTKANLDQGEDVRLFYMQPSFGEGDASKCAVCEERATKTCAGCKVVRYCSAHCRLVHWHEHKHECRLAMADFWRWFCAGKCDLLNGVLALVLMRLGRGDVFVQRMAVTPTVEVMAVFQPLPAKAFSLADLKPSMVDRYQHDPQCRDRLLCGNAHHICNHTVCVVNIDDCPHVVDLTTPQFGHVVAGAVPFFTCPLDEFETKFRAKATERHAVAVYAREQRRNLKADNEYVRGMAVLMTAMADHAVRLLQMK